MEDDDLELHLHHILISCERSIIFGYSDPKFRSLRTPGFWFSLNREKMNDGKIRPGRAGSTDRRFGRGFLYCVAVVSGIVVDIASNLIEVAAVGPTRFGDPYADIRITESLHRENYSVHHLVEEVAVGQARTRIRVRRVLGPEQSVV